MSLSKVLFCSALVVAALPSLALADVNLVTNGGFETGDFTGWTQVGNIDFSGVAGNFSGVDPAEGAFQAFFGPVASTGGIVQSPLVSTSTLYNVSFWLYNFGGTPNSYDVSLGGVSLTGKVVDAPAFGYTEFSYTNVAAGPNPTIQFLFQQNPSYFLLDNVVVTAAGGTAPTPEPGIYSVLGLGLAGLAFALRRRKSA